MKKTVCTLTLLLTSITLASLFNACNKPAKACFTYSPTTITTTTDVIFDASCSEAADGYKWSFVNSRIDTTSSSPIISHRYNTPGTYTITLTVDAKNSTLFNHLGQTQTITVQ